MIGVIYARYSSDSQKEESIDGQLRECKAYAEKNGIQIMDTYIDRALSAKTDNRPRFQHMIKDSSSKNFEVILVARMLHNRKYIGEYKFKDVITPGGIPAIVDKELFELVQEKMKQNKKAPAKHKAEDEYLLTTKLYCGKCQCLMVGESGTSRTKLVHRYYKCVSVKNHKGCDKKTVKKAWIEDIVIDSVRKLIMNDETIEYLTDLALETFNQESTVLPILQKQYAQTLTAINNLITAMEQGIITPTTKARMDELEAEKSELSIRIMKEEMSRPKLTREEILYWFYKFRKLNPKKLDHRRILINNFVNSVFLYEDRMVINFNFKDSTETITFADLEKSALGSDLKVSGAPKQQAPIFSVSVALCKGIRRDLNPKRVRSVKKTVARFF